MSSRAGGSAAADRPFNIWKRTDKGTRNPEIGVETNQKSFKKPVSSVILNQQREFKLGKNHPPFLKGGRGD